MRNETLSLATDYRHEFADFEGVAYLNNALQSPLPLVSARAAQEAIEWKKHPYRIPDSAYFDLPDRIREKIARLIRADAEEIAVTTGASAGMACVAAGIDWKPGDEVVIGRHEFPAHFATWLRYRQAGKLGMRIVEPRGRFIDAEDYLPHIGPQTRVVSASLVRFDDGAMLDAARVARACQRVGAALLLDVSQCAGAIDFRVRDLGATMAVCSGYKWLLGPYGSGFFWIAREWIERLAIGPIYFMGLEGARDLHAMFARELRPAAGARRWDSAETANFTNLAALDASLDLLERIGRDAIRQYTASLVDEIIDRIPRERCVLASPERRERRGPYVCVSAKNPDDTAALFHKLKAAQVSVSLREGALRISPFFYNTPADISRLIETLKS
ncbi:MAG TPA: aminotransferase class V-fold PLP-dependent enzyme [Candidatus Acidoferrum sp.]|jgi:selenocysteine lyase/cysteine desulfurase|nr:aminotransferase class V-fold PLP-dependent enzyme [Candidatus Acidoferrum sp.]